MMDPSLATAPAVESILADLIACADLPGDPNARIAACIVGHLARHGVSVQHLPGPEGDRVNLFATIGPADRPGTVLSGHMDVVPVEGQNWASDPFTLTERAGRLYGRGTSDMKGFLACVLAVVPDLLARPLARPIHIALTYDEEIGCRGAPHLIKTLPGLCATPTACIVGEPSGLVPVLSHKGKQALEIVFTGRAAHSSDPGQGINALYPAAELMLAIRDLADEAQAGPHDARFAPPFSTVVGSVLQGGTAVNIIPDRAVIRAEVRTVPGVDPATLGARILQAAEMVAARHPGLGVQTRETARYPALPPAGESAFIRWIEGLAGTDAVQAVAFGTEAGLFHTAGIPAVICGPGDIARAHRADEYILRDELAACCVLLRRLGASQAAV